MCQLPVAVTLEFLDAKPGECGQKVLARFASIAEAEEFIASSPTIDPLIRDLGLYGIDAPEELINPAR